MSVVNWDYAVSALRDHVVRVVFEKKGNGAIREMWATRNNELIYRSIGNTGESTLGESVDKLNSQKNNNNVVVFDLEVQGFRTIPLDNILGVDQFNGVDGWIEFNLNDEWKDVISGKIKIQDVRGLR